MVTTGWRKGFGAMRRAIAMVLVLTTTACVQVIDATPKGIWLKEPMISFGSPDAIALEHCARYGKRALKSGELGPGLYHLPIEAYECR